MMVSNYELAVVHDEAKITRFLVDVHTRLVDFSIKHPTLVYGVGIRNHDNQDGSFGTVVQFQVRNVTQGITTLDFYFFDPMERLERKFKAAQDFVAGAITSLPERL